MEEQEYRILICQGSERHQVAVRQSMTVRDLSKIIEDRLSVLQSGQKIIHRGKTLTCLDDTLGSCRIYPDDKVLVLGRKFDPESDEMFQAVAKVDASVNNAEKKFVEIVSEVNGIKLGYLAPELHKEAKAKLSKRLLGVTEELMRMLEELDGLSIQEDHSAARQKRKTVVKRIQQLMDRTDQVQDNVKQLC
ncbi:BAG family molecular chaperone regulator 1-like isoform X2 [Oratosquilla oratoria]